MPQTRISDLGVVFKIFHEHFHHFYMGVYPPGWKVCPDHYILQSVQHWALWIGCNSIAVLASSIKIARYPLPHLDEERHFESEGRRVKQLSSFSSKTSCWGVGHFNQIDQYWHWLICLQCDNNQVKMKKYFLNFAGMNTMEGVVMLASTNRQDILDQVKTQC